MSMLPPPARIGAPLDEVETPALIVDLDVLEKNVGRMAEVTARAQVAFRPHSKTHKSTSIAHMQIAAGAVGICCQKVSEAEIMVNGGVGDVLVANEIVGSSKLARLAALARRAKISVCVDHLQNVRDLERAAAEAGAHLHVLVELDVGGRRCGVQSPDQAVDLAKEITASGHLSFAGLQAYHGGAQHIRTHEERGEAIGQAASKVRAARDALARAAVPCPTITGAGTGSFEFEIASEIYTELQAGSYVFMDRDYKLNQPGNVSRMDFEQSLFILTTIMSRPLPERIVIDAGLKSYSTDSGPPEVAGMPGLQVERASDEHGIIMLADPNALFSIGEKLRLVPGHCDPTVNLHDWFVCVRSERVEALWPVSARGAIF
jgi:D-serine deaminase-like pyridoxal phosphate-dependent protein